MAYVYSGSSQSATDARGNGVAGITGGSTHTEVLIVYEAKSKKPLGNLEITTTIDSNGAAENKWK